MAEEEASPWVMLCGWLPHGDFVGNLLIRKSFQTMTNIEQDRWARGKGRLRSSVGEDVYTCWFARMDLESVQHESVHLSVPTRFLKSWIQAHYAERVLTCWQAEMPEVHRIDLTVRSAMRCATPAKDAAAPLDQRRAERTDGRPARGCAPRPPQRIPPPRSTNAAPSGPTVVPRPNCAPPRSRRCPPATMRW